MFPHRIYPSYKNYKYLHMQSSQRKLFYIQNYFYHKKSPRNTTTTRLNPCRQIQGILQQLFPMHPSILHSRTRLQGPYSISSTSRLPVNSIWQKQHSKQQAASTLSLQQFPGKLHLILPRIITGSSITCHCNTTRSVCSNLLILALRIILQEN